MNTEYQCVDQRWLRTYVEETGAAREKKKTYLTETLRFYLFVKKLGHILPIRMSYVLTAMAARTCYECSSILDIGGYDSTDGCKDIRHANW